MTKKRGKEELTKKDPNDEIKEWVNYKERKQQSTSSTEPLSHSMTKLKEHRRRSLTWKLALVIGFSLLVIVVSAYYISPFSDVASVTVSHARTVDRNDIVKASGIKRQDKVIWTLLNQAKITRRIQTAYPSVKSVSLNVKNLNHLQLNVVQHRIAGYIKNNGGYQQVLENGQISPEKIPTQDIKQATLFIGYANDKFLKRDLKLINAFPKSIRDKIRVVNHRLATRTQIILVMADKNVIIGDVNTIGEKIKVYQKIAKGLSVPSLVDFEVGAFSKPLSQTDALKYGQ